MHKQYGGERHIQENLGEQRSGDQDKAGAAGRLTTDRDNKSAHQRREKQFLPNRFAPSQTRYCCCGANSPAPLARNPRFCLDLQRLLLI